MVTALIALITAIIAASVGFLACACMMMAPKYQGDDEEQLRALMSKHRRDERLSTGR